MSSESVSRAFCLESIRYAYQILGYDTLIKEIEFIHHLQSKYPSVCHIRQNIENTDNTDSGQNTDICLNHVIVTESKNDLQSVQKIAENTNQESDQEKEIVIKKKRGRKPLSSKNSESTDVNPIITHDLSKNSESIISHDLSNNPDSTCSFLLSNGLKCAIKKYTVENPNSVYCFNHSNAHC